MEIYKITNIINGKVYIGQTKKSMIRRFNDHKRIRTYRPITYIQNEMLIFGVESFILERIEYCLPEYLDDRERFWINFYNSTDNNLGYNKEFGGIENKKLSYPRIHSRETIEKLKIKRANNYEFYKSDEYKASLKKRPPKINSHLNKKIICIETNKIYDSIRQASKDLNIGNSANITSQIKGRLKTTGGYTFKYI